MEDRLLVWRCKRGSAGAMAQIYRKYRKDLLILAVALLNDKAVAEDIVQDVFVRFVEGLPAFRLTGHLRTLCALTCPKTVSASRNQANGSSAMNSLAGLPRRWTNCHTNNGRP
jgi:hypothetical protein